MYTIDLLKGTGRPPGPRVLPVVITTLAFVGLVFAAVYGATDYVAKREQISVQSRRLAALQDQLDDFGTAAAFLKQTAQQRQTLQTRLAELKQALAHELQWSPILLSIAEILPPDVTLYNVTLTRKSEGIKPEEVTYHYLLTLGLLTPGDPLPVENFMQALGARESLKPQLKEVRVANQSQQEIRDHEFLYIVIECRFDP